MKNGEQVFLFNKQKSKLINIREKPIKKCTKKELIYYANYITKAYLSRNINTNAHTFGG
jgi:hypothetical protein